MASTYLRGTHSLARETFAIRRPIPLQRFAIWAMLRDLLLKKACVARWTGIVTRTTPRSKPCNSMICPCAEGAVPQACTLLDEHQLFSTRCVAPFLMRADVRTKSAPGCFKLNKWQRLSRLTGSR